MRADVPFLPDGAEQEVWCAIAVKLEGDAPGTIPEIRGWGAKPVGALASLHEMLVQMAG